MVKYSRVSLARKKELEKPDEIIGNLQKFFAYIVKHGFQVAVGLGVLLTVIAVYAGIRYFSEAAEGKASALLDQEMTKYNALLNEKGPVKASQEAAGKLESIATEYPGTAAAGFTELNLANMYYAAGEYDKAITRYEKAATCFDQSPLFRNLIYAGLGRCHEAKGNRPKAAAYFEMVVKDTGALLADEALFNLGRIYAEMGEQNKSLDAYKKIISNHGDSIYAAIARENAAG
ncbi:MAG: tetratricopeptide repeat protein [Desulfobacterales bacterium]